MDIKQHIFDILNNMNDSLIVLNPNATIAFINPATEEILGYKKEELCDKPIGNFIFDEDMRFLKMIRQLVKTGVIRNFDFTFRNKNGDPVPINFSGSLLRDENNKMIGIIGVSRDMREITDLIKALNEAKADLENKVSERTGQLTRAFRELKETQSQLVQREKLASLGQLSAGVAHEINNPISFVHSNLGTLNDYAKDTRNLLEKYFQLKNILKGENGDIKHLLEEIEGMEKSMEIDFLIEDSQGIIKESLAGIDRVAGIVKALKDFSNLDQAELKICDLNHNLENTLNIIAHEIKNKNIAVLKDFGEIPPLECYPKALNMVFFNILLNAVQAIADKGVIGVRTRKTAENIVMEISDTGGGIAPENLNKIFDPFFTTKALGQGTGLGLSIAYGIIRQHQGEIEVESELNKGTVFKIILPLWKKT